MNRVDPFTLGYNLKNLGIGPLDVATHQISKVWEKIFKVPPPSRAPRAGPFLTPGQ